MKKKIKFGIAGTGRMAQTMLRVFRATPDIDVIAVCSASLDRAKEFASRFSIGTYYGDIRHFIGNDAIEAIYIANHNLEHGKTAIAALNAGKAVLCEKPFAVNVEEGQAVLSAVRATRVLFMEAMWTPFLPAYRRLHELARSGSLGTPTHVNFSFGYPTSAERSPALFSRNGGGVLLDRSAYGIVFALSILGPVDVVDAAIGLNEEGVDVSASLQLTHRAGGQAQLGLSLVSLMPNAATVACTGGVAGLMPPTIGAEVVFFRRIKANGSLQASEGAPQFKEQIMNSLKRRPLIRRVKTAVSRPRMEYHSFGIDPYAAQTYHFIELMRTGHLESDIHTPDSALAALKIIETARTIRNPGRIVEIGRL
jgi:predicted dehydrogenase